MLKKFAKCIFYEVSVLKLPHHCCIKNTKLSWIYTIQSIVRRNIFKNTESLDSNRNAPLNAPL